MTFKQDREQTAVVRVGNHPSYLDRLINGIETSDDHLKCSRKTGFIELCEYVQHGRVGYHITIKEGAIARLLLQGIQGSIQFEKQNICNGHRSKVCHIVFGFFGLDARNFKDPISGNVRVIATNVKGQSDFINRRLTGTKADTDGRDYHHLGIYLASQ